MTSFHFCLKWSGVNVLGWRSLELVGLQSPRKEVWQSLSVSCRKPGPAPPSPVSGNFGRGPLALGQCDPWAMLLSWPGSSPCLEGEALQLDSRHPQEDSKLFPTED